MTIPITATFAVLYALMLIVLSTMVSIRRAQTNISMFQGDDVLLGTRMRRHGNFVEIMPFVIILMGLCDIFGAGPGWLYAMGIIDFVGRIAHAVGLDPEKPAHPLRIAGGMATQGTMLIAMGYLIWKIFP